MEKYEAAPVELLASKISVWWDITSCPVPEGYDPRLVRKTIESKLKKTCYSGPLTITSLDARMGKKIQEDELDDFNVEPVGIVCRGTLKIKAPNNAILCKDSASRSYVGSALVSEALAVRNALRAAAALGLTTLNLFSDSLVLISTLLSGSDLNEIVGLLVDLRNLASLFNHLSFSHVSPTCNVMADSLAKSALARLMADNALFRA
ncbi:uncharacterized protein LOC106449154 [Brassica napus]|uniref:uncharacterized protein LOC106449154 n=1 Tax=Brassica napus TaxID=3708 RepID=UPI000BBE6A73|nr:uncharacterized protein LOC106449154 [Brassica napus]